MFRMATFLMLEGHCVSSGPTRERNLVMASIWREVSTKTWLRLKQLECTEMVGDTE